MSEETKKLSETIAEQESLIKAKKFLDLHLDSVQEIIKYVIDKTALNVEETELAKRNADDMISYCTSNSKYLGEVILASCFFYDGTIRTLMGMVQDKIQPISSMNLDQIAAEVFQMIKKPDGKVN